MTRLERLQGRDAERKEAMTKEEALAVIKLLSAMESWSFSLKQTIPDYLHEDLQRSMEVLERVLLEKQA